MPLMDIRCPDLAYSHISPDLHGDEGTWCPYLRQTLYSPRHVNILIPTVYILAKEGQ